MPTNYFPAQIEQLKRKAKLLARSSNVSHNKALDQVAIQEGFTNWSLLMKSHQNFVPYRFERSEEAWKEALRPTKDGEMRRPQTFGLESIYAHFVSPWHATNFALEYMRSVLSRPRYQIHSLSLARAEMRWWLPYVVHEVDDDAAERIILNRHYKPVGYASNDHVDYRQFGNLHSRPGIDQLRRFSNRAKATGYLFDDGNAPWGSRKDAVDYAGRLEQLCEVLGDADLAEPSPGWTYMQNVLYEELAPWARTPTWYTSHPADEKRLLTIIAPLRRHQQLRGEDLRIALLQHRKENVEILGGKAPDSRLEFYVKHILGLVREPT